jgi:predicted transposase YbfD/YdcC
MAQSSTSKSRLLFEESFADLRDPRDPDRIDHPLINILMLALAAVLCGAVGWEDIALTAHELLPRFEGMLDLTSGAPSADTFGRVFGMLNPDVFARCFAEWIASAVQLTTGEVVAFDGKTHRGSRDARKGRGPLHTLHVWATRQRLLLQQRAVEGAPGEVQGIVEVLKLLRLRGAVVTTDANGCTRQVAQSILDGEAGYLLALKKNRAALYTEVQAAFERAGAGQMGAGSCADYTFEGERGHGRQEFRQVWTLPASELGSAQDKLPGLRTIGLVQRARRENGTLSVEDAFYVSSLEANASQFKDAVRAHWGVENDLHHALDVGLGEDASRVRDTIAAHNLGIVRRLALTLLRKDASCKMSLKNKTRRASLNAPFLLHLLSLGNDM